MPKFVPLSAMLILALVVTALAADDPNAVVFNQKLKIGDAAPAWKDLAGTDGKSHALDDLKDVPVVVAVFTCNSCPTARDYEDRTLALVKRYESQPGKVRVVAINCNKVAEDSLDAMTARAKERAFTYAYVTDPTQGIAKEFGAITTPQYFVLNAERKIVYIGALDDDSDPSKAKTNYVAAAIDATLAGKAVEKTNEPPRGCLIRFTRERGKK
ncbi:MAG: thioredoxin family protein [Pirellulales bacterium]